MKVGDNSSGVVYRTNWVYFKQACIQTRKDAVVGGDERAEEIRMQTFLIFIDLTFVIVKSKRKIDSIRAKPYTLFTRHIKCCRLTFDKIGDRCSKAETRTKQIEEEVRQLMNIYAKLKLQQNQPLIFEEIKVKMKKLNS